MNIIEEIGHAKVIGITGHIRPDGDCVGSTLGLYNYIRKNLPECQVTVYLEKPSDEFNYLSGINDIKHEAEDKHFDLFVVLDCSSMDRIEPFMSCLILVLCIGKVFYALFYVELSFKKGECLKFYL